jgi:predicted permease
MTGLIQDIRLSARRLSEGGAFTLTACQTLAVALGFTTAVFALVQGVLLRPLPFPRPDRLVKVSADYAQLGIRDAGISPPELFAYRDRAGIFEAISGIWPVDANLTGGDEPVRVEALATSPNYFELLGAKAAFGRVYGTRDAQPGFAPVAVISDGLWRRVFGGDPGVIGRVLRLDEDLYEIIGVMPPAFRHPNATLQTGVEVWVAAGWIGPPFPAPTYSLRMLPAAIGRLEDGVAISDAQDRLEKLATALRHDHPDDYPERLGWTPRVIPLREDLVGGTRPALALLMAAVLLVLVIACSNIANLLLARALGRERDVALRLAIGASRARVVREMVVESLMLAAAGGFGGFAVSLWLVDAIVALAPARLPRLDSVAVDAGVFGFVAVASIGAGLLVALAPAVQMARPGSFDLLRQSSRTTSAGLMRTRLRTALVIGQFAMALVLVVVGALLFRSLWRLNQVDPGFDPSQVTTANLWLPAPNNRELGPYNQPAARVALLHGLTDRLKKLPGVEEVGIVNALPMSGTAGTAALAPEEWPLDSGDAATATVMSATPGFFRALRVPLLRGRFLDDGDTAKSARVVVVNQAFARMFWPNADAVGKRVRPVSRNRNATGAPPVWLTVVGVIGDMKMDGLDRPVRPQIFQSMYQASGLAFALTIRAARPSGTLAGAITTAVRAEDANLPVFAVTTLDEVLARATATRRFSMTLVASFGLVALLLASLGLYAVMAYVAGQRRHEIGVRIALGASPGSVVAMMLGQGVRLVGWGIVIGTAVAVWVTGWMSSLLFGVSRYDPVTFVGLPLLLVAIALPATYVPARRASRVDPAVALRQE